ncbi:MAG TPA: pitrilysin family protein [Candidatus Kapabacteria bacterium]|nr:pitrilysin family protein [Candidatus Kapabacteria bacterium]
MNNQRLYGLMQVMALFFFLIFFPAITAAQNAPDGQHPRKTWKNRPERIWVTNENKTNETPFSFIFQQDTASEITVLRVLIAAGKKAEPLNRKGLAFLTTRLAVEIPGTSDAIKLMTLGSSLAVDVEGDYSCITVTCLSENLDETIKIVAGVLKEPLFSALRISSVKNNMTYRQKNEEDNTEFLMEREYLHVFLGNSGYGGSIFGTAAGDSTSLHTIKKKDIEDFYNAFFNRAHMAVVVSSDLSSTEIETVIKKYFLPLSPGQPGQLVQPVQQKESEEIKPAEKKEYFFKKENTQALVSLGALLPGMSPNHFVCALMLENLVGGGIGSRIWPLRVDLNLAYSLKAKSIQWKDAGIIWVYLKTDNSRKEKASRALPEIVADLYKDGVSEEEFNMIKVRTRAHFLRINETKEMRTFYLGLFELTGPGFDFFENFFSAMDTLTASDFNAYIRQVLKPDQLVKIIIGPGEPAVE